MFLVRDGRPLTSAAIQHALRRLGGRAGLDGVRTNPHTFRHIFAKLYLLNGGDLFSLHLFYLRRFTAGATTSRPSS